MLTGIAMIFKKELINTLRDRKTLIFMALIPTLAVPVVLIGINRVMRSAVRKQAVQEVTIAADAQTHETYRRWIHEWMLDTNVAAGLRVLTSPIMKALLKPEMIGTFGDIPSDILTDPNAFESWIRGITQNVRQGLDTVEEREKYPDIELPEKVLDELVAFYRLTIKGLALVRFVDPATLDAPPLDFDSKSVPNGLASHPYADAIVAAIKDRSIHGYLDIPVERVSFDDESLSTVETTYVYDSTINLSAEANRRIRNVIDTVADRLLQQRLADRGLDEHFIEPLVMKEDTDVASKGTIALAKIGEILPMVVFLFAFLGGLYPAIDLGAGEKEHNTLEALILSPTSRTDIALGKLLVILLAALVAALLGVLSIALSVKHILAAELLEYLDFQIDVSTVLLIGLLVIPPAAAFSGIFLAISIYARTFKEAQNYLAPLQFIILLPAMAPVVPGLEMNWKLALIPLVNVSMISKDFLKGEVHWGYYFVTLATCVVLAGLCVVYAVRQFKNETVLFRS